MGLDAQAVEDSAVIGSPTVSSRLAILLFVTCVADQVFLLTPTNVEVSQEEKDRLQARGLYQA